jgi:mannose-6-phosphate isomerase-like protein (cupin superfamily)
MEMRMTGIRPEDLLARIIHGADDDPKPLRRRTDPTPLPTQHWTGPVLLERAAYLKKMARAGQGFAIDTISEYPGHRAILAVRLRPTAPEILEGIAQLLFVLEGRATLITGDASRELRPGDVVHIAGGVSTQFNVPNEKPFSCLVLHITEIEED